MRKTISTIPFIETEEQAQSLVQSIESHKSDPSMVMVVMQKAQDIYGYLPFEVQERIAEGMSVPLEKVYGIATFYAQYTLSPKGKYHVAVCLGTACYVRGAGDLFSEFSKKLGIGAEECTEDNMFSLAATRCIGACGLAPVLTVNDDVFGKLKLSDVDKIIAQYKNQG